MLSCGSVVVVVCHDWCCFLSGIVDLEKEMLRQVPASKTPEVRSTTAGQEVQVGIRGAVVMRVRQWTIEIESNVRWRL